MVHDMYSVEESFSFLLSYIARNLVRLKSITYAYELIQNYVKILWKDMAIIDTYVCDM